jgi:hypothetical protein
MPLPATVLIVPEGELGAAARAAEGCAPRSTRLAATKVATEQARPNPPTRPDGFLTLTGSAPDAEHLSLYSALRAVVDGFRLP